MGYGKVKYSHPTNIPWFPLKTNRGDETERGEVTARSRDISYKAGKQASLTENPFYQIHPSSIYFDRVVVYLSPFSDMRVC